MALYYISELIGSKLKSPVSVNGRLELLDDRADQIRFALTSQFRNKLPDDPLSGVGQVQLYYEDRTNSSRAHAYEQSPKFVALTLSKREVKECFDKALNEPLKLAAKKLRDLETRAGRRVGIVVAGGSLRTQTARDAFTNHCPISLRNSIKFACEMEITWR